MSVSSLPAKDSVDWMQWATDVDTQVRRVDANEAQAYTDAATNSMIQPVIYTGTVWPNRPSTTGTNQLVLWIGPGPGPASGGTTTGGTPQYAPGDLFFLS